MSLLDFLFPKYCVSCRKIGEYICPSCFSFISFQVGMKCLVCDKGSFNGLTHPYCKTRNTIDGVFSGVEYKGIVKKLVYTFKYKPYLLDLQSVLGELLYESLIQNETFMTTMEQLAPLSGVSNETIVFVPIPLHSSKLRSRGYNQSEVLARLLSRRFKLPVASLLVRNRNTTPQFGLKRDKRFENMEGAFEVISNPFDELRAGKQKEIRDKNILLVDDVLTTGATLSSAARVLKKKGAKRVFGVTFAID